LPATRLAPSRAHVFARTRFAAVAVAAVAATAGALAVATPASATVSTTLSPMASRTINAGTSVLITARLLSNGAPVVNRTVVYHWRASSTDGWHVAGTRATNSSGYASLPQRLNSTRQYRMRFAGDTTYTATNWVTTTVTVRTLGQRAVQEASRHRGAPYQYGAAGPTRFDCSGFTMYVFGRLGRSLPHNAAAQYSRVRHLTHSQMRVGDLLFFTSGGGISHVGIYAGSGRMWAATHTGDVVRLQSVYTPSYYVGRVV
jgi:cell wall-associated NlpC family hydrolase